MIIATHTFPNVLIFSSFSFGLPYTVTKQEHINHEFRRYETCSVIHFRMIKSKRMRWAGHVARMGEKRNAYRIFVGKPEGKRPLGRTRRRRVDNIKMDLREIGCDGMDWIDLAQDRDQWRALVNTVMNIRVP
jgi:hypothetical protein